MLPQPLLGIDGHFAVQHRQDVRAQFHQRHGQPAKDQILGHLQPDHAATDHQRMAGMLDRRTNLAAVGNGAQHVNTGQIDAGQGRPDRFRAGGYHQGVIVFLTGLAGLEIAGLDDLALRRDDHDLGFQPDLDVEAILEQLWCRHQQLFLRLDHITHEIR